CRRSPLAAPLDLSLVVLDQVLVGVHVQDTRLQVPHKDARGGGGDNLEHMLALMLRHLVTDRPVRIGPGLIDLSVGHLEHLTLAVNLNAALRPELLIVLPRRWGQRAEPAVRRGLVDDPHSPRLIVEPRDSTHLAVVRALEQHAYPKGRGRLPDGTEEHLMEPVDNLSSDLLERSPLVAVGVQEAHNLIDLLITAWKGQSP